MSTGQKSGKGTHGALIKAGKVRNNTPKCNVESRKVNKIVRTKDSVRTEIKIRNHRKKHACLFYGYDIFECIV